MPGVAPFLPAIGSLGLGLLGQNIQNKQQQAAVSGQNQQAISQMDAARQAAMARMKPYLSPIQGPPQIGQSSYGGGFMGSMGPQQGPGGPPQMSTGVGNMPVQPGGGGAPGGIPPAVMAILQQLTGGHGGPPQTQMPTAAGGMPPIMTGRPVMGGGLQGMGAPGYGQQMNYGGGGQGGLQASGPVEQYRPR